jgi:rhomboid protease GluP
MRYKLDLNPSSHLQTHEEDHIPIHPHRYVTLTLLILNILIFLTMVVRGVPFLHPTATQVLPWGANFGPLTTSGQWWRLLTACFLHFGVIHIAMNMYILYQIGFFTEMLFGSVRYLLLYLMTGIAGNIAGLYVHPLVTGAGASGAIFGIYGGLLGFLLIRRGVVPRLGAISIAKSAGIFITYNLIYGLVSPNTDLTAHTAGLLSGFVIGCLFAWSLAPVSPALRNARAAGVALLAVAISFTAAARVPKSNPAQAEWYRQMMTGPGVTVGNKDHLVYTGTATRADAEAVAKMLFQTGLYRNPNVTLLFRKDPGGSSVSIPFSTDETQPAATTVKSSKIVDGNVVIYDTQRKRPPFPWENPALIASMKSAGPEIASAAGGLPFSFRLLNGKGELKKEISIDTTAVLVGKRDRVSYSGHATADDARALGRALQSSGFFKDIGMTVYLVKSAGPPEISFVVGPGSGNPTLNPYLEGIARKIASSVGGLPMKVDLIDVNRTLIKQFTIE